MLLHLLQFIIQILYFYAYANFNPQDTHYKLLSKYLRGVKTSDGELVSLRKIMNILVNPWYCLFPFLELLTIVIVWMEFAFPTVKCSDQSYAPLSFYYYPILMTIVDIGKLNVYMGMEKELWYKSGNLVHLLSSFMALNILFLNLIVTVIQGLLFAFSLMLLGIPFFYFPFNLANDDLIVMDIARNPVIETDEKDVMSTDVSIYRNSYPHDPSKGIGVVNDTVVDVDKLCTMLLSKAMLKFV